MKVLVTGSNGFIGSCLLNKLAASGHTVRGAVRERSSVPDAGVAHDYVTVGSVDSSTDWAAALGGMDAVVHLAARVHVMNETDSDPLNAFYKVNVHGTRNLAEQAAKSGIKRFVYVSSIKVNGERTGEISFVSDDDPKPVDPYGLSKAEAEQQLLEIAAESDMEVVIVRPPLVYGPGVGGNILRLIKLVESGIPLPLGSVKNRRSMISLDNITDFLARCLTHPKAVGRVFIVSDGMDWSTSMLVRSIAKHMDIRARVFPFPLLLLKLGGWVSGQSAAINRLCDSLELDITETRELLDWNPPQLPEKGMQQTVAWYLDQKIDSQAEKGR